MDNTEEKLSMLEEEKNVPLVSICIPIYNVCKYLERCIDSLLDQTYPNVEYIFVDDCSTDDSLLLLKRRLINCQLNYYIIENRENIGLAATRNIAIEHVHGRFITWVDSDDYVSKEMVAKMVATQIKYDCDIVTVDFIEQHSNFEQVVSQPSYLDAEDMVCTLLARKAPVCIWGRLIRTSLYKDNAIKPLANINCGEDYQVTARLAYYAHSVKNIHETLYYYNCTNEQSYTYQYSRSRFLQDWKSIEVLQKFFRDKRNSYQEALEIGILKLCSHHLVACCQAKDKALFYELHTKIRGIAPSAYVSVPFFLRLVLYIPIYTLARLYIVPTTFTLKFLKQIKRWLEF
ncbi:glycosyltransferase family 2 protein [Segatella oris]|nr:glycosyltransferase family 2 protein [Segatella oris]